VSTVAKKLRKTLIKAMSLQQSKKVCFLKRDIKDMPQSEDFAAVMEDMPIIITRGLQQSSKICQ
jgi:hypothetical protein